ncbi:MAG: hypothetical protein Q9176_006134 [Flavoplaca citrina]
MQNQPGATRQFNAEIVQNGLYGLILNWPADKLDERQKGNLTRLQHHFVGRLDDSADHDSSDATPLHQPETPTTTDSPSRDDSNSFNKAILAVTKLELDSSLQEFVENGFDQDQLQEVLMKDSSRSVSKLAKACRLMKLLFLNRLCQIQSPQKPIIAKDKQEVAKISEMIRKMPAEAKKFVGREIIFTMKDPDQKRRAAMIFKSKTVGKSNQATLIRLNELDISGEAKKSGMDKLGEIMLALIEEAWEKGQEVLEGDKSDTHMNDGNSYP